MNTPLFSHSPTSRLYFGIFVCCGLVVTGIVGWATNQNTVLLNGFIAAVGGYGYWYQIRLWRDFTTCKSRDESVLQRLALMTRVELRSLELSMESSIVEQVVKTLSRHPGREQELRGPVLDSYKSALVQHVDHVAGIAQRYLPAVGMAGTVYGLQLSMLAIAVGVTGAVDAAAITSAIVPVVASLGMAFTTTLTALLIGTLVLGHRCAACRSDIDHYFVQLDAQLACFPFPSTDSEEDSYETNE